MHQAGHQLIIRIMKSCTQFLGVFLVVVVLVLEVGLAEDNPRTIVTPDFFNSLLSQGSSCKGKGFYSYEAFISAAENYRGFGTTGDTDVRKREMAAFLANVMHETGSFCHIKEKNRDNYCDRSYKQYPCAPGKKYFGRGPLQLSWNYNYGAAGDAIGFDGLKDPGIVGRNPVKSFKTAVWFWMSHSTCHHEITNGGGFGSTIRAINSLECGGGNSGEMQSRVRYYRQFCRQFGVHPGQNIEC